MTVREAQPRAVSWKRTTPYAVAAGVPGVVTLVMIPWWLNLFGPAAYGRYAVTWTMAIACSSACVGWIRQSAMRAAGTSRTMGELPRWVVPTAVLFTGVATAGAAAAMDAVDGFDVLAAGAMGAATAVSQLVATVLQREDRGWRFAASEAARVVLIVVFAWLLGVQSNEPGARTLLLATAIAGVSGLAFVPWKSVPGSIARPGALGEWWSYGWPLSAWLTFTPLVLYTDRLVLQLFANPQLVGTFAALSDLVVRGIAVLGAPWITSGTIWAFREFNAGGRMLVLAEMRRLTVLASAAALALAAGALLAHGWLTAVFGLEGLPAACFPLLALGGGLWQAALFAHKPLELARLTGTMLLVLAGAVVLVAGLCFALVPGHGAVGAASGLVIGVAAYLVGTLITISRRRLG